MIPWIPWLFVLGLGLSALGLATSIARFEEEGSPTGRVVFLALSALFFAWTVALWVTPRRLEPRIVPYFARRLAEYGGDSSKAFARGHGLYRDIAALDRLARSEGARALSEFGFADDHYDQHVRWHPARDGLATVEALRKRIGAGPPAAGDVALDLEALAVALRLADGQDVPFSLALRLRKDDIQAVSSQEQRQGHFW